MPPAASIAVVLNASAGTATKNPNLHAELAHLFRTCGCDAEVIQLRAGQDPTPVARDASARASIVAAGGGDGTVSAVAAGIYGSNAALGVLPLGTLNHLAKDLHIPTDLREAVAVVAARHVERIDVGEVNGRVFINNSSIGIYPSIVEEREQLQDQGYQKWLAAAIATFRVFRRYRGVRVRIDVQGLEKTWRTPFVVVSNNEYAIDGIGLGARPRLDQGRLFVYLAPRSHTRDLPVLLAKALAGRATQSGAFEIVPAAELTIDRRTFRHVRVALDGEVMTMSTPLRYRTCPRALPVVVPQN